MTTSQVTRVEKPWGYELHWAKTDRYVGKLIHINAGHALNYFNVQPVAALPGIRELHIGHAIVSRAIFVGMREAVAEMKRLMREAQCQ